MMICHFCHKPCDDVGDLSYFTLEKWDCRHHLYPILFTRYKGSTIASDWTFHPIIDDIKWRVKYHCKEIESVKMISCEVSYLKESIGDVGGPHWVRRTIAMFDFDPDISPENFAAKLPTIVVFS